MKPPAFLLMAAVLMIGCLPAKQGNYRIERKSSDGTREVWYSDEYPVTINEKGKTEFRFKDKKGQIIRLPSEKGKNIHITEE